MQKTELIEEVFINMIIDHIDDLRSGKLPKSKFIGKYMERISKIDKENAFRFKKPQVIGDGKTPNNNWLDYIIGLSEEEFFYFKESILKE